MSEAQQKYIDYVKRVARTDDRTLQELNRINLIREVGISYGLSEEEIEKINWNNSAD